MSTPTYSAAEINANYREESVLRRTLKVQLCLTTQCTYVMHEAVAAPELCNLLTHCTDYQLIISVYVLSTLSSGVAVGIEFMRISEERIFPITCPRWTIIKK